MCIQGIAPELHSYLVSQVGEDIFAGQAMLPLELLPAEFLQSATQCACYFANVQEQVSSSLLLCYAVLFDAVQFCAMHKVMLVCLTDTDLNHHVAPCIPQICQLACYLRTPEPCILPTFACYLPESS